MADEDGTFNLADRASAVTLQKVVRYVGGMMRAKIPGGSNGPRGPVFPPQAIEAPVGGAVRASVTLRLAGTHPAQGAYKGFVQKLLTNAAGLTITNNVSLASMMGDAEEVVFWNQWETTGSLLTPTNGTHALSTNSGNYVPAFPTIFSVGKGTNQLKVYTNHIQRRNVELLGNFFAGAGQGEYTAHVYEALGEWIPGTDVIPSGNERGNFNSTDEIVTALNLWETVIGGDAVMTENYFAIGLHVHTNTNGTRIFVMAGFGEFGCS